MKIYKIDDYRKAIIAASLTLLTSTLPVLPATITGNVIDIEGNPASTNIIFTPLSTPLSISNKIVYSTVRTLQTDTNGTFSIWLEPGNYKATIGTNWRDSFILSVPAENSTNDWTTLITTSLTYAYPVSPVYEEKRFRGLPNGYASLNGLGLVPQEALGSGTPTTNTFLRGDAQWRVISPSDIGSGSIDTAEFNSLDGISTNIQLQLNQKASNNNATITNLTVQQILRADLFRQNPISSPPAPAEGDTWLDSAYKTRLVYQFGAVQALETVLFSSTNNITVTNTTIETLIVPAGIGTTTLPPNFLQPGKSIIIRARGIFSTPSIASSATFKLKIGNSTLTTSAFTLTSGQQNKFIHIDCQLSCNTAGTNGAVFTGGYIGSQTFTYTFSSATNPQNQTMPVDTTVDNTLAITVILSRTDVSLTINTLTIQLLY